MHHFSQNAIFRWNSGNDYPAVLKDEDKQSTTGSYVINIKGCDLYYRHGNVTLNKKDVIARSYAKFKPELMTYQILKKNQVMVLQNFMRHLLAE